MEHCENCDRTIGKLEIAHTYRGHTVCAECIGRVRKQDEIKETNSEPVEHTDYVQSEAKRWNGFCITAFVLSLLLIPGPTQDFSEEILRLACGLSIIIFVLSITFAWIGLYQIGKNPSMRGKGLGIAAIIISLASVFIAIIF